MPIMIALIMIALIMIALIMIALIMIALIMIARLVYLIAAVCRTLDLVRIEPGKDVRRARRQF